MADIKAFNGIRYNEELIDQLELLTTPPYDVINGAAQEEFYESHPYNIIRLELPKGTEEDGEQSRYVRAAATFKNWLDSDVLVQETEPAIYIYQQEFDDGNNRHLRTGFITSLKAEPYDTGTVLPHEETISKHKEDRLRLLRSCNANFSSIFGLYNDADHQVDGPLLEIAKNIPPHISFEFQEVEQRIWIVKDPDTVATVSQAMGGRQVYIADGHHRYETAVQFGEEMKAKGEKGFDRVMITLVNLHDPGLVVYPTHRLVKNIKNLDLDNLLDGLKENFLLEPMEINLGNLPGIMDRLSITGKTGHAFVLYAGGGKGFLLQLAPEKKPEEILGQDHCPQWRRLDVSILHGMVLEAGLGIDSQSRAQGDNLAYTRDDNEALTSVDQGDFQLSFLMNPTKVEEVTEVASAGDKMPQKSTYFYPKLVTGLVINPLV